MQRRIDNGLAGETRMTRARSRMTAFALCAAGRRLPAEKRLGAASTTQLRPPNLPDGGPSSRNPADACSICCSICCRCARPSPRAGNRRPPELLNAIDRMRPALRMFRHGDGSLALFNGMGVTAPDRDRHRSRL